MLNLNKLDFTALEVFERNYLKSVQDVKLHLTVKSLGATIEAEENVSVGEADKATSMTFVRKHMMTHCKSSTLQSTIEAEENVSCMKQDTTSNTYTSKTLTM
ncbi:hypothetical protein D8674_012672 [Pyrus ussuriensis x Pyrus communis]|uniref:Uncharacterized protein n=1 Tax=Pyrus ussuriensis x Pyrus communis TaxID=2448454 RepID=A0A5N5GFL4_9ROSA|nr:hypothetical protein D8674_012672 [Pyrus ussuriensis x Pyrus communis]